MLLKDKSHEEEDKQDSNLENSKEIIENSNKDIDGNLSDEVYLN